MSNQVENKPVVSKDEILPMPAISVKDSDSFAKAVILGLNHGGTTAQASKEITKAAKDVWDTAKTYVESRRDFAKAIYQLALVSGSTYNELAKVVVPILNASYSKMEISRLIWAGKALTIGPKEIFQVKDVDKLAVLGKVQPKTMAKVLNLKTKDDQPVITLSRSEFTATIQKLEPKAFQGDKAKAGAKGRKKYNPNKLLDAIKEAQKRSPSTMKGISKELKAVVEYIEGLMEEANAA
jgi:hypothetical protein